MCLAGHWQLVLVLEPLYSCCLLVPPGPFPLPSGNTVPFGCFAAISSSGVLIFLLFLLRMRMLRRGCRGCTHIVNDRTRGGLAFWWAALCRFTRSLCALRSFYDALLRWLATGTGNRILVKVGLLCFALLAGNSSFWLCKWPGLDQSDRIAFTPIATRCGGRSLSLASWNDVSPPVSLHYQHFLLLSPVRYEDWLTG